MRVTRRHFMSLGLTAAATLLGGCAARRRDRALPPPLIETRLDTLGEEDFRRLTEAVLNFKHDGRTLLTVHDSLRWRSVSRDGRAVELPVRRERELLVVVQRGERAGSAVSTSLTVEGAVAAAEEALAVLEQRAMPADDVEFLPALPPTVLPTMRIDTLEATPDDRAALLRQMLAELDGAGDAPAAWIECSLVGAAVAASTGLRVFERRTLARARAAVGTPQSRLMADTAHRSLSDLGAAELAGELGQRARRMSSAGAAPTEDTPLLLAPNAVAALVEAALESPGERPMHERLTLRNHPFHPALIADGFDACGAPTDHALWVDRGALRPEVSGRSPYSLLSSAPHLSCAGDVQSGMDALVRQVRRGLLVPRLSPSRTGGDFEASEGALLITGGEIAQGVTPFVVRGAASTLRQVESATAPAEAVPGGNWKMLAPALLVPNPARR